MRNNKTTIHLGLYGRTSYKTLYLFTQRLRADNDFTGYHVCVNTNTTGEVVLVIDADYVGNGVYAKWYAKDIPNSAFKNGLDVTYIKKWFSDRLMRLSYDLSCGQKMPSAWTTQIHPKSKTSSTSHQWEIDAVAMALVDGPVLATYGQHVYDKVVSKPSDPIRTEINGVIVEEALRISGEFDKKRDTVRLELNNTIRQLRKDYRAKLAQLGKEERKAISDMKKEMLSA